MFRRDQRPTESEPVIDADELRKRLLGARALDVDDQSKRLLDPDDISAIAARQPNHQQNRSVATAIETPTPAAAPANDPSPSDPGARTNTIKGGAPMSQTDLPGGPAEVAKTFEPSKIFQDRLSKLVPAFDQVDKLGKEATAALEQVTQLADHLAKFAAAYAPVKALQSEVTALAEKFNPLKSIQSQLAEMSLSFRDHLNYLVAVMEPARKIRERLAELAQAFEPADELKERFQQLAREFEALGPGGAPNSNGKVDNAQQAQAH
jgi:hypothetical protein